MIHQVFFFLISDQGHYTFLYGHTKHDQEGGRKEQTNKHRLGLAPSERGASLLQFCAALRAFTGYRGRIFARNFHEDTRNADSSLDCQSFHLLTVSFCCVLLWTAISSRLFTSAHLCQLTLSVFSGTFLPLLHFRLAFRPFVWVLVPTRTKRSSEWHQHKRKRMLPTVSKYLE